MFKPGLIALQKQFLYVCAHLFEWGDLNHLPKSQFQQLQLLTWLV